jgi:transposase
LKQRGRGTYQKDKPPIITIVERNTGLIIFSVEKNLSKHVIQDKIEKHCIKPVKIFTDDYTIYSNLKSHEMVLKHDIINHGERKYAEGETHVNNTENGHSLLRLYLNIFRGVSKKNLNIYVKFFQFIHNNGINWLKNALKTVLC